MKEYIRTMKFQLEQNTKLLDRFVNHNFGKEVPSESLPSVSNSPAKGTKRPFDQTFQSGSKGWIKTFEFPIENFCGLIRKKEKKTSPIWDVPESSFLFKSEIQFYKNGEYMIYLARKFRDDHGHARPMEEVIKVQSKVNPNSLLYDKRPLDDKDIPITEKTAGQKWKSVPVSNLLKCDEIVKHGHVDTDGQVKFELIISAQ